MLAPPAKAHRPAEGTGSQCPTPAPVKEDFALKGPELILMLRGPAKRIVADDAEKR